MQFIQGAPYALSMSFVIGNVKANDNTFSGSIEIWPIDTRGNIHGFPMSMEFILSTDDFKTKEPIIGYRMYNELGAIEVAKLLKFTSKFHKAVTPLRFYQIVQKYVAENYNEVMTKTFNKFIKPSHFDWTYRLLTDNVSPYYRQSVKMLANLFMPSIKIDKRFVRSTCYLSNKAENRAEFIINRIMSS